VIVDLAPDAILVTNDEGRIVMSNRHADTLFGYDHGVLVGMTVESLLPPQLRLAHEAHRADYETAPSVRPMGSRLSLSGCRSDGAEFPIDVSLSPASTDDGSAVTVVAIRSLQ
jgi:PAS domain S-box-containing protein